MDAVELNYPVDVVTAPPKLVVASEGFGSGRDRVTVTEVEAANRVSILVKSSRTAIEHCNSLLSEKDVTISVNTLESTSLNDFPEARLCLDPSQPSSLHIGDISREQFPCSGRIGNLSAARSEEVQVQKRVGKVPRSSNGCPKRPRLVQFEDTAGPTGVENSKDLSNKQGLYSINCESHEKIQLSKQKNGLSSKRGDRRSFKVSMKTKYDSFSVKSGASFNSATGGNNLFGLYGLKTDLNDITELVDDLSLNDLLDGTFKSVSLAKDKGKKPANTNENILPSIRKACSILQLHRPAQSQLFTDIDSCSSDRMALCQPSALSVAVNGENDISSSADLSSSNKDSCSKPEAHDNLLDFPIYQPKDILESLALPAPKDLESLLVEVTKSAVSSRNSPDLRPSKQMSRRTTLPPFSWSHAYGGHHRTNTDAVKLLTSKTTCQGRWVRIRNIVDSLGAPSNCYSNLEVLTYDESLVPSFGPKLRISENNDSSMSIPCCGWGSALATPSVTSEVPPECGDNTENKGKAAVELCPRILAAAQTLCDMAFCTSRLNQDRMMRWPKKPSQKAMKARKSKSNEKLEEILGASTSQMGSFNMVKSADHLVSSKRPKYPNIENKRDLDHINGVKKGPVTYFPPKSSRSSPNKLVRDSVAETRHSDSHVIKQSCMLPPPAKVPNRTYNSQPKVRKLMRTDWNS